MIEVDIHHDFGCPSSADLSPLPKSLDGRQSLSPFVEAENAIYTISQLPYSHMARVRPCDQGPELWIQSQWCTDVGLAENSPWKWVQSSVPINSAFTGTLHRSHYSKPGFPVFPAISPPFQRTVNQFLLYLHQAESVLQLTTQNQGWYSWSKCYRAEQICSGFLSFSRVGGAGAGVAFYVL